MDTQPHVPPRTLLTLTRDVDRVASRQSAQISEWALEALQNLRPPRPQTAESLGTLLIRTLKAQIPLRSRNERWRVASNADLDDLYPESERGELVLAVNVETAEYHACPGLTARCDALHPELLTAVFAHLQTLKHFAVWTPYNALEHIRETYWDSYESDTELRASLRRQMHLERGVEPDDAEIEDIIESQWGEIPTLTEILEELGERYCTPSSLSQDEARELCAQDGGLERVWTLGEALSSIPLPYQSYGYAPCALLLDPQPELGRNAECFEEAHRWVMEDCDRLGGPVVGLSSPHLKTELTALQTARTLWAELIHALKCLEPSQEENTVNTPLVDPHTPEVVRTEPNSGAAQIEMDLPLGESALLSEAWLLYQTPGGNLQDVRRFKVVHDPEGPRLGVGLALTRGGLEGALESLAPRGFTLLPPEVLAYDGRRVAFYLPPEVRPLHFEAKDQALRQISGQSFPQPGLIFDVLNSKVRIAAFKGRARPTANTPIFRAPYYNLFDDDGVCWGTTGRPGEQLDPEGWARAYFASSFTHGSGLVKRSRFSGSHAELWAAAGVAGRFSPRWLAPHSKELTLEAWLQNPGIPGR